MKSSSKLILFVFWLHTQKYVTCVGPDPWHQEESDIETVTDDFNIPPDLRIVQKQKTQSRNFSMGEWFSRRLLAIVLKGGQIEENVDGSVNIHIQMKFNKEQWETLNKYLLIDTAFSEDVIRRSVGYIEDAICKPSLLEKIVLTWSEYIMMYFEEYKIFMMWTLGIMALATALYFLQNHRNMKVAIFIIFYLYEAFVSYKEVEQQEFQIFMKAVNSCKWYFWTSHCDIPQPDPLIFLKHMNPLKIAIRMFTTVIAEPIVTLNEIVKVMLQSVTDELWYPFNKIMFCILMIIFIISLVCIFTMIIFNYILNVPFDLNFGGLLSLGVKERSKSNHTENNFNQAIASDNSDRLNNATLNKILDICLFSQTNNVQNNAQHNSRPTIRNSEGSSGIRRTASAGRLTSEDNSILLAVENKVRKRKVDSEIGGGDAR